jgi:hypothetical protein
MRQFALAGVVATLTLAHSSGWGQDGKQEYDLTWKLPHNKAAAYEVFDCVKGTRRGEFWLFGCELETRVAITDYHDLPNRLMFRRWPSKVKAGSRWEIKEFAFAECPPGQGMPISPVQIVGSYSVRVVKKLKVDEHFKVAFKSRKEKQEAADIALIEGSVQLFKAQWSIPKGVVEVIGRQPATSMGVTVAVRVDDGAIVAGRYLISGRIEQYQGRFDFAASDKANDVCEVALRVPLVDVTKEGLAKGTDDAVRRGIQWLKSQQGKDGKFYDAPATYPIGTAHGIGSTAMGVMALIHSGVPADDPAIRRAFSYLLSKRLRESYDAALVILAVETKYAPLSMLEDIERFSEDELRAKLQKELTKEDRELAASAVQALLPTQDKEGLFGYVGGLIPNFSNTQYAVLALNAASRMGIDVPTSVWSRVLKAVEKYAQMSGREVDLVVRQRNGEAIEKRVREVGWPYAENMAATGTMTCAALASLAICESALLRAKALSDQDIRKYETLIQGGWAWMQSRFSVRAGVPEGCSIEPAMLLYYMYGIERAAILWDAETIGGHNWYLEGAAVLLSMQQQDGRWTGPEGWPVVDTAWALLFLKRATIPVETPARIASIDRRKKKESENEPKDKQEK